MKSCAALLFYLLVGSLGSSFAALEESRYEGTLIAGPRYTAPKYPESIQIFMRKRGNQYWYIFWQGPSGIAGYINIPYRGMPKECYYISTGRDAGQFRCGSYMIMDCRKDPQYQVSDDSVFHCGGGEEYHRGFVCEY
ncbi:hypothetical protein ACET3X_003527 [Alternaria dauci]|uniref:Uncharacterized protein n=1 Tax=Alternaria dauci TaxID=48095 RepID=A0ABR3UTT4_9PLEO